MTASMSRLGYGASAQATRDPWVRMRSAPWPRVHGQIAETIESQIVPRLLLSRARLAPAWRADAPSVEAQEVVDLAAFAIAHDGEATRHYLLGAAEGRALEAICFDLLAPAARHLGELWTEDLCSFTDVTLGMLHLQHALHGLTPVLAGVAAEGFRRHRILLAPVPGEQHTFGLSMVQSFFRRGGWNVTALPGCSLPELLGMLRQEWFGVLGLSVGSGVRAEWLADALGQLRRASRNAGLGIIVGGPIFVLQPALAAQIGADGTAADGLQATWLAENLLGSRALVA